MRSKTGLFNILTTAMAILISLAIAFVIIFIVSEQPMQAIRSLLFGPVSSLRNFGTVIEMMIPITFTGLAVSIMFQASQFNLAAEGSFFLGALAAAAVATQLSLPPIAIIIVCLLAGAAAGLVVSSIPAVLKARFSASEMVSSLMLNYIVLFFGLFVLNHYLRDPGFGMMASFPIPDIAKLTQFVPKTRIHVGLFIAILFVVVIWLLLYKTKRGYSIRTLGHNEKFAHYSGIGVGGAMISSQMIGGAVAGLGGSVELLGMYDRFQWTALPGYGWDGVIIAILARNKPQYVVLAALFLAYLRIGSGIMARMTDVPSELITIIQAIMIMLVTAQALFSKLKHKMVVKETIANGNVN